LQAFDHGGKALALGAMLKALAEEAVAGLDDKAVTDARAFIDWAD
jgi:hypothetical protein